MLVCRKKLRGLQRIKARSSQVLPLVAVYTTFRRRSTTNFSSFVSTPFGSQCLYLQLQKEVMKGLTPKIHELKRKREKKLQTNSF